MLQDSKKLPHLQPTEPARLENRWKLMEKADGKRLMGVGEGSKREKRVSDRGLLSSAP